MVVCWHFELLPRDGRIALVIARRTVSWLALSRYGLAVAGLELKDQLGPGAPSGSRRPIGGRRSSSRCLGVSHWFSRLVCLYPPPSDSCSSRTADVRPRPGCARSVHAKLSSLSLDPPKRASYTGGGSAFPYSLDGGGSNGHVSRPSASLNRLRTEGADQAADRGGDGKSHIQASRRILHG